MFELHRTFFPRLLKRLHSPHSYSFHQIYNQISEEISTIKYSAAKGLKAFESIAWNDVPPIFVRLKVHAICYRVYVIAKKDPSSLDIYTETNFPHIAEKAMKFLSQLRQSNQTQQFLAVTVSQVMALISEPKFVGNNHPIQALSKALCLAHKVIAKTAYLSSKTQDKESNTSSSLYIESEDLDYLLDFYRKFASIPVKHLFSDSLCLDNKHPLAGHNSPFKDKSLNIDSPEIPIIYKIEQSLIENQIGVFTTAPAHAFFKYKYFIHGEWIAFLQNPPKLEGEFITKEGPQLITSHETYRGLFYLHKLFLFLVENTFISQNDSLENIRRRIIRLLKRNSCWNNPASQSSVSECNTLLAIIPPSKLSKYIMMMFILLGADEGDVRTAFKTHESLFKRSFSIKYLKIKHPLNDIALSLIPQVLHATYSNAIQPFLENPTEDPSYPDFYLNAMKSTNKQFQKFWTSIISTDSNPTLDNFAPDIDEADPDYIYTIFSRAEAISSKQISKELDIWIRRKISERIMKVDFTGLGFYLQDTLLTKFSSGNYGPYFPRKRVQASRERDFTYFLRTLKSKNDIKLFCSRTDNYEKYSCQTLKIESIKISWKPNVIGPNFWGEMFFFEVLSIFEMYFVQWKNSIHSFYRNSRFLSAFDSIYYVLAGLRYSVIQTPVRNPKQFLWSHIKDCLFEEEFGKSGKVLNCPAPKIAYRESFYFFLFWLMKSESIDEDYFNFETQIEIFQISGTEAFLRYASLSGNLFEELITTFCAKYHKKKYLSICRAIDLTKGINRFLKTNTNLPETLIRFTEKPLDLNNVSPLLRGLMVDAYTAGLTLQRFGKNDNFRFALNRLDTFINEEYPGYKNKMNLWKTHLKFSTSEELFNHYEPIVTGKISRMGIIAQAKSDRLSEMFTKNEIGNLIVGKQVLHEPIEFLTRYSKKNLLKLICDFVTYHNEQWSFINYNLDSANPFELDISETLSNLMTKIEDIKKAIKYMKDEKRKHRKPKQKHIDKIAGADRKYDNDKETDEFKYFLEDHQKNERRRVERRNDDFGFILII